MTLQEWIEARQLTQEAAAKKLGIKQPALNRYLKGRFPSPPALLQIIKGTGGEVTADSFFYQLQARDVLQDA